MRRIPRGLGAGSEHPAAAGSVCMDPELARKAAERAAEGAHKHQRAPGPPPLSGTEGNGVCMSGIGMWDHRVISCDNCGPGHWVSYLGPILEQCWKPVNGRTQEGPSDQETVLSPQLLLWVGYPRLIILWLSFLLCKMELHSCCRSFRPG